MIISAKCLDCKPYNKEYEDITWENCSLRSWLNNDFMNEAFSGEQQACILKTNIPNDDNTFFDYTVDGGNDTMDKIFILSILEAELYFNSDYERQAEDTQYAIEQGASVTHDEYEPIPKGIWWLRSPGTNNEHAATVDRSGEISYFGGFVEYDHCVVRPAMMVSF